MINHQNSYPSQPHHMQHPQQQQVPGEQAYAKLVFSNLLTSIVIGKNGENINALRQNNGVRVRISPSDGSSDRVCIISGPMAGIRTSLHHICDLISQVPRQQPPSQPIINASQLPVQNTQVLIQLSIPETSVSAVIGRKGSRISEIRSSTGARIKICDRGQGGIMTDRLIMITGDNPSIAAEATGEIVEVIQLDPELMNSMKFGQDMYSNNQAMGPYGNDPNSYSYPHSHNSRYYLGTAGGPARTMGQTPPQYPGNSFPSPYTLDYTHHAYLDPQHMERIVEMIIPIHDAQVGQILGKAGKNIADIKKYTGANITVSPQNEFFPGTDKRLCTISGGIMSVHLAHARILRRICDIEAQKALYENLNKEHQDDAPMDAHSHEDHRA